MKTKTGIFLQFIPSSALCLILICAQLNEHSISKAQTHSNRTAIILISVDTLRADSLSCYGSRQSVTSEIDLLTAGGTLFSQVSSTTPLTLPAHLSLLSSTYPLYHGVEDNGQSIPSSLPTLATILKSHGYRTAGFVGSFVLDQRFGMSRGFDFYDSPYDLHRRTNSRFLDSRRFGEDVVQNAEHWIAANAQEPFFVFIHLYDMHKPYELPRTAQSRLKGTGYGLQLSYVDEVLGRFWTFLKQQNLFDKSLIVFTADHGEGLGEHGESTHGYYVYESTLRVPLIIHWPATFGKMPSIIKQPISLIDVAPVILGALSFPTQETFQGRNVLRTDQAEDQKVDRALYSESMFARDHFGCSALRSLRFKQHKYIDAPRPELYDLSADPKEKNNLYVRETALALKMQQELNALMASARSSRISESPAMTGTSLLGSLGYIARNRGSKTSSSIDPKDRIRDAESYYLAATLAASNRFAESIGQLERLQAKLPEVTAIYMTLGMNLQKLGKHTEAVRNFRKVLKLEPNEPEAHYNLALSLMALQEEQSAVAELQTTLTLEPLHSQAHYLLGTFWMQQKNPSRARLHFREMLKISSLDYAAHYSLALLANQEGKLEEAERHLQLALHTDHDSVEAYSALGGVYLKQTKIVEAEQTLLNALAREPKHAGALYNMGVLYRQQGKQQMARNQFRQALAANPNFVEAKKALDELGNGPLN